MASIVSAGTTSATSLNLSADTSGVLQLASNNGTVGLTMDTSQNVGIGTTSPATFGKFAVLNNGTSGLVVSDGSTTDFRVDTVSSVTTLRNTAVASLAFNTNGGERMRIDSSGNVGIGTSSPLNKLQIKTQTNGNAGFANSTSVAGGVKISCYNDAGSSSSPFEIDGSTLQFNIAAVEKARIDSSGNLLVGTTSGADFKLRVNRSGNFGIATFTNSETSGLTYDQTQIIIGQAAGSGYMFARYYTSAGAAAQFAFRGDGQMLATSTSIASISDARTKENVRESSDGLNTVLGLRAVRFDFKEGFSNNRKNQLGFIAQEVEAVFPDAVDVSGQFAEDESEYKTVAPGTLIPVLVKAIQEQQALIEQLQADVAELKGAA